MQAIQNFCSEFGINFEVPSNLSLRAIGHQLHLFTEQQVKLVDAKQPVTGGGIYLGEINKNKFTPSAQFIDLFLKNSPYSVTVDEKTAYLYLCGRDIIEASGIQVDASEGSHILVKNQSGEILGYGITQNPKKSYSHILVKNKYDKGSMLRREMSKKN
jgi:ribosome biogenesis protein Nip4